MNSEFNTFLVFLDSYANLILVMITAVYAFMTYQMVKIMKIQIVANIKVAKVVVKSSLLSKTRSSKFILLKEIVDKKIDSFKNEVLAFVVSIDIYNASSGNGSIDQPKLIIKFKKSNFCLEIRNKDEEMGLRKTIHLSGGDFEKRDFEYFLGYNPDFLKKVKRNPGKLEYYIKYKDNQGRIHLVRVENIAPLR